jgi:transposase
MRGRNDGQAVMMFSVSMDERVPVDHPLRRIRASADAALARMTSAFDALYAAGGRPSIPPERLLKASLLIALYSVRSERLFCEQLRYNLLFRWFLDMNIEEEAFDASTFSKNRGRLLSVDAAGRFLQEIVASARAFGLLSDEHFTVDGTLIEAWASHKSFVERAPEAATDGKQDDDAPPPPAEDAPQGKDVAADFRGERRTNDTHASTTDPQARLARKGSGREARLCFAGHVLMDNRTGLCADVCVTPATGTAEREAALDLTRRHKARGAAVKTVGADKGYDTKDFVRALRDEGVTPHVAAKARYSAIDARTTRHPGYEISQRIRKRVEQVFGWMKTVGGVRRTRYKGTERTGMWAKLAAAAFNLVRMAKLLPAAA